MYCFPFIYNTKTVINIDKARALVKKIHTLLANIKKQKISVDEALEELKTLPFKDLGFAKIDTHRALRRGFPEVIYGERKTNAQLVAICGNVARDHNALLVTRARKDSFKELKRHIKGLKFDEDARLIYKEPKKARRKGLVLVVAAGTSDQNIAKEAEITARVMGNRVRVLSDVGVAGIHRLLKYIKLLRKANVIIVIAGMEGALASVVSGLVSQPVIAVPTSVGYGASFKGIAPLLTMLNSCSPGVTVVNIDNGFGAGYFASMINK